MPLVCYSHVVWCDRVCVYESSHIYFKTVDCFDGTGLGFLAQVFDSPNEM